MTQSQIAIRWAWISFRPRRGRMMASCRIAVRGFAGRAFLPLRHGPFRLGDAGIIWKGEPNDGLTIQRRAAAIHPHRLRVRLREIESGVCQVKARLNRRRPRNAVAPPPADAASRRSRLSRKDAQRSAPGSKSGGRGCAGNSARGSGSEPDLVDRFNGVTGHS